MPIHNHITSPDFAIILVAAGASNRLGKPKQLLPFNGHNLLQHNINVACNSLANEIVIVLGANAEIIKKEVNQKRARLTLNTAWQEGIASSIRCGLTTLLEIQPSPQALILMLCDQPYTSTTLINSLFTTHHETGTPIIACSYANTFGPPALFHKSLFPELLQLKGDTGARQIIHHHQKNTTLLPFPQGNIDIDTPSDYQNL